VSAVGRRPVISRQAAVAAALAIIDEHGLEALSLDGVARRLGTRAPSLYHHFTNRADLLSETAAAILRGVALPDLQPEEDWCEHLVQLCVAARRAVLDHPNAAPLLLEFLPRQTLLGGYERWARLLIAEGVPPDRILMIMRGTEQLTFGAALFEAALISKRLPPYPGFDPARNPSMAVALQADRQDPERLFASTVRSFLLGLGART
jgi:TetR/AcrR family transcriptional regulator, tetracycline repressor protein